MHPSQSSTNIIRPNAISDTHTVRRVQILSFQNTKILSNGLLKIVQQYLMAKQLRKTKKTIRLIKHGPWLGLMKFWSHGLLPFIYLLPPNEPTESWPPLDISDISKYLDNTCIRLLSPW